MASSGTDHDFITLLCKSPSPIEPPTKNTETLISTNEIHTWDSSAVLRHQTLRIHAHRNELLQHSSYFRGLIGGNFSESNLQCVSIQWNLEILVNVLKVVYGCRMDVASNNFLPLFEAALYFGIEAVLVKCKNWFSEAASTEGEIQLDDLIHIWNFGLEHANDFVPEICASYLARNFMWAITSNFFGEVPYNLLLSCLMHPSLTVYSEMRLCDALLIWLDANTERKEPLSKFQNDFTDILKQIRISLLPLWFAAGKKRSDYFSELADESIGEIFRLMEIPPRGVIDVSGDGGLDHLRIRVTEYSKKMNLSGCPQITSAILLLSLLPSSYSMDVISRKSIKQSLINLEQLSSDRSGISRAPLPILSFEAVEEVDISRCPRLHLGAAIECFSKSFPSLRKLKAAFFLNIKTTTLLKLVQKCPLLTEVDLTVDISPLIPAQISLLSSSEAVRPQVSNNSFLAHNNSLDLTFYYSGPSLSNITNLTLEGRSDVCDSDLLYITKSCVSLHYLNLKGCVTVTDIGISNVVRRCAKLHSILVCDTSFGINSVLAFCSAIEKCGASPTAHFGEKCPNTLACKLQTLHMGGCKGVDQKSLQELISHTRALKSLCLRGTYLGDDALYSLLGSSLETLDVSNTMVDNQCQALDMMF